MEISAVIVARSGSVRIKNKSMLKIGNETLISNKIKQLISSRNINRIIFGSDSDEMLEHASSFGVDIVKRPRVFCDEEKSSANDMIKNMLDLIKTDIVVWTHCTNPFVSTSTYDDAIDKFLLFYKRKEYDSLLSVVNFQEHLWNEFKKPLNYDPYSLRHTLSKDLPIYYMQDGSIFIQPYLQMKLNSYFFGKNPYLYSIPTEEFLDINTLRDYYIALAMYEQNRTEQNRTEQNRTEQNRTEQNRTELIYYTILQILYLKSINYNLWCSLKL